MVPKDRRGLVGGLIQGAFPIGFAAVSLVSTITLSIASQRSIATGAGASNPALAKCAVAVPAMAANMQRARTSAGLFLSLAGQPQSKGT